MAPVPSGATGTMTPRTSIAALGLFGLLATAAAGRPDAVMPPLAPPDDPDIPVVYLVDLSSGAELVSRNADRRFVPASVTKAMTLLVAFDLIDQGKLSLDQELPISDETFRAWRQKGSTMFIPARSRVRVSDLLMGIANVSANDGSIVLAEGAGGSVAGWAALMNAKARELGMHNSHFGTPNGWADGGRTFTTAHDLAILARAMVERHPELYARFIGHPGFTFNGITQPNHDPMIGKVAGADGIKTGYTSEAGNGYLGSAQRNGRRLVVVVAGADNQAARGRLARDLTEWGFASTNTRQLFSAKEQVAEAMVQAGDSLAVPLVAGNLPIVATLPRRGRPNIALSVHYEGPLRAPIRSGEAVAELEIRVDGMPPSRVPLFAGTDVGGAEGIDRLWNGLAGLVRW